MHPHVAPRHHRASAGLAGVVATMVALAGCAIQPTPSPSSVVPSPSSSPNSEVAPGLPITLDPAVIPGLDSSVDETLQAGDYYYISLPKVPGEEAWTTALRNELTPQLDRFKASTRARPRPPTPSSM